VSAPITTHFCSLAIEVRQYFDRVMVIVGARRSGVGRQGLFDSNVSRSLLLAIGKA
jgi:hypothetical protein